MGDRRCCCGCTIQATELNSEASLIGGFTLDQSGNFSYDATVGGIKISAADQTATANTLHPQSPYPPRLKIEFYGDDGAQPRIILGGKIVAQVTVGDTYSQLQILNEADDSEICPTLWMHGIANDEWHVLQACYDPDTGVIKATVHSLTGGEETYDSSCEYDGDALDATAAFGTGPDHSGNVYVRKFHFWRLWYCGAPPYTEDCPPADDYYYGPPLRTYCSACEISCTVISQYFADFEDGDMPPDWDVGYTDWHVVDGTATGDSQLCHNFNTTGGSYIIQARFALGELGTLGDFQVIALSLGASEITLTVTRIAGAPGAPDRLLFQWNKPLWWPDASYEIPVDAFTVQLTICPRGLYYEYCEDLIEVCGTKSTVAPENVVFNTSPCVSITQPTLAGHTDAALLSFTIQKSSEMHPDCPSCTTYCDFCKDPDTYPLSVVVELSGFGNGFCNDCPSADGAYYLVSTSPCEHSTEAFELDCTYTKGLVTYGPTWVWGFLHYLSLGIDGHYYSVVQIYLHMRHASLPWLEQTFEYHLDLGEGLVDCPNAANDAQMNLVSNTGDAICTPPAARITFL